MRSDDCSCARKHPRWQTVRTPCVKKAGIGLSKLSLNLFVFATTLTRSTSRALLLLLVRRRFPCLFLMLRSVFGVLQSVVNCRYTRLFQSGRFLRFLRLQPWKSLFAWIFHPLLRTVHKWPISGIAVSGSISDDSARTSVLIPQQCGQLCSVARERCLRIRCTHSVLRGDACVC